MQLRSNEVFVLEMPFEVDLTKGSGKVDYCSFVA